MKQAQRSTIAWNNIGFTVSYFETFLWALSFWPHERGSQTLRPDMDEAVRSHEDMLRWPASLSEPA